MTNANFLASNDIEYISTFGTSPITDTSSDVLSIEFIYLVCGLNPFFLSLFPVITIYLLCLTHTTDNRSKLPNCCCIEVLPIMASLNLSL